MVHVLRRTVNSYIGEGTFERAPEALSPARSMACWTAVNVVVSTFCSFAETTELERGRTMMNVARYPNPASEMTSTTSRAIVMRRFVREK